MVVLKSGMEIEIFDPESFLSLYHPMRFQEKLLLLSQGQKYNLGCVLKYRLQTYQIN